MRKKNKLFLFLAVCAALCVPAHAEDSVLSMDEAMEIILEHHSVETDMDVSGYLTLDAEEITREAAVTAVVRSFGVYPADEADYVWADEGGAGRAVSTLHRLRKAHGNHSRCW